MITNLNTYSLILYGQQMKVTNCNEIINHAAEIKKEK